MTVNFKSAIKYMVPLLIIALTFTLHGQSSYAAAPDREDYIIKFSDNVDLDQEISNLERSKITASRVFRNVYKGGVFSMTSAQASALARNPRIEILEKDQVVTIAIVREQNLELPWGLDRIDAGNVTPKLNGKYSYEDTSSGSGVTAYVIDTGIYIEHSQFEGRAKWGKNLVDPVGMEVNTDCDGHGTHVAGTIGGKDYGVAKKVTLVAVKVLNCKGSGTWSGVIAGMDWVVGDHNNSTKAVANLSLGGGFSSAVNAAADRLTADNIVVAVAAGNDGRDAKNFSPASATSVITVGATDRTDTRANFSNFGTTVELFAPGVSILSSVIGSTTSSASYNGTSMASPHVAGVAARLLSACSSSCGASAIRTQLLNQTTRNVVLNAGRGSPTSLLYVAPNQ